MYGPGFPDTPCTDSCDHDVTICKACTQWDIYTKIYVVGHGRVQCPECPRILNRDEIRSHGGEEAYEKFREGERKAAEQARLEGTGNEAALTETELAEGTAVVEEEK